MAGFVAGYRTAGRGWLAGLIAGLFATAGLFGVIYLLISSKGWSIYDLTLFMFREYPRESWFVAALLALLTPASVVGGLYGDRIYSEYGQAEDRSRHTLFAIPWWHWLWLCLFLPAVFVNNLVLSGHLLVLALRLVFEHLIRLSTPPELILSIAPFAGFLATFFGLSILWKGLSIIHFQHFAGKLLNALAGAFLLIFGVNVIWGITSTIIRSAIESIARL